MTAAATEPQPFALEDDFRTLNDAVTRLSEDIPTRLDATAGDLEAAVLLLADLREARKRLAQVEAYTEAETVRRMRRRNAEVSGFLVERKGGTKRTDWQHDRLAWAVVRDLAVDGAGVVDDAALDLIGKVRDRLVNAAGITYWRSTQLRPLGIDPGDYSTAERGRYTIHLTPAVSE